MSAASRVRAGRCVDLTYATRGRLILFAMPPARTLADVVRRSGGAVSVSDDVTVAALARTLAAHSVDAAAVLTASGTLAGIATATDLAKLLARGESRDLPVAEAMTSHPTMLPGSQSPTDAIILMRSGGFRHLPVVDVASGAVLGIVDVLNLAYDAITRLQASYAMMPTKRGFSFMRAARETFEKPTVKSFLGTGPQFVTLRPENTVLQACEQIVKRKAAAIIVVDANGGLEGIFTCRDVATRVVARNKDPGTTLLADVMTPRPDFALPEFTVLECLQRMQACGFRHLPVIDNATRKVIGLVDVLQLASDALLGKADLQLSQNGSDGSGGFGAVLANLFGPNSSSQVAFPPPQPSESTTDRQIGRPASAKRVTTTPTAAFAPSTTATSSSGARIVSTLNPSDLQRVRMTAQYPHLQGQGGDAAAAAAAAQDMVNFKFKDSNGEYRRVKVPRLASRGAYDQLVLDIRRRYFASLEVPGTATGSVRIRYLDEDGDPVVIASDDDLSACFQDAAEHGWKTIKLKVSEVHTRRGALGSEPSPVSSRASSIPGSPKHELSEAPTSGPAPSAASPDSSVRRSSDGSMGGHSLERAPAPPSPSTAKAMEGHTLLLDQQIAEAIIKFDEAVQLRAGNARAVMGRAAAKLINGDKTGAEEDYRLGLSLTEGQLGHEGVEATYETCVVGLVETLIEQTRYEEAVSESKALQGKPSMSSCIDALRDEFTGSQQLATDALGKGEYGEAMTCFNNAIRVERALVEMSDGSEPASASMRNGRGKCYLALDDYEMALEDFEEAVKLDPESVAAFKGCGKCYVELDQPAKALDAYRTAGRLDSGDDGVQEQIRILEQVVSPSTDDTGKTSKGGSEDQKEAIAKLSEVLGTMKLPGPKPGAGSSRSASATGDLGSKSPAIPSSDKPLAGPGEARRRKKRGKR